MAALEHRLASMDRNLLPCIVCSQIAEQPLLLRCLHNCCTLCADLAAKDRHCSKDLLCTACDVVTDMGSMRHHNGFIAEQGRLFKALRDVEKCNVCTEEGHPDEPADAWCKQCQRSLCSTCVAGHQRYNRAHVTIAIEQITSWIDMVHIGGSPCLQHGKQLELLCFDCMQAKCTDCVVRCEGLGHCAAQTMKGPKGESFLKDARESVRNLHIHLLNKSEQLHLPINLVKEVQLARATHLDELKTSKKKAMDALSQSYEDAQLVLKDIYDQLEENAEALQCLAKQAHQSLLHASNYARSLADTADAALFLEQQSTVTARLQALDRLLEGFKSIPDTDKLVTLNGSLPENLTNIFASWLGYPVLSIDRLGRIQADVLALKTEVDCDYSTAREQQLTSASASSTFLLQFHCNDLSVTSEGHLLLAARVQGLREYEITGLELSCWIPPERGAGESDKVTAVTALNERRAAVGMFYSQLILLLQHHTADNTWLVDRSVAGLQSPPWQISVQGEVLAVTHGRLDGQLLVAGSQLQLMRHVNGQKLYSDRREYNIWSLVLTSTSLVTASADAVELSDGREMSVVDCYSHRGDRLWRHPLSSKEWVAGVSASLTGLLYVAVAGKGDRRSHDCVRVVDGVDGKQQLDIISSSSHELKQPRRLSLSRGQRRVLAVLSHDESSKQWRTVTVYSAEAARTDRK